MTPPTTPPLQSRLPSEMDLGCRQGTACERTSKCKIKVQEFGESDVCRECVVIERLEMVPGGMVCDAPCQGLTTGPLTKGKVSRKFELKVNGKWHLRSHYPH